MPTSTAELVIACKTTGQANLDKVNKSLFDLDGLAKKVFGTLTALLAGNKIVQFGKDSVKVFSDLQESTQKFNEVFKGYNDEAERQARILEEKFGASARSAKSMMSLTGDLLTGFGFGREEALKLSAQVAQLGSDIASFSNYAGGAEGATVAITKAMLGETEMAKMLGIAIKTDSKEYKELYKQIQATRGTTDSQTKALAALQIAFQQKGTAMGDFERNLGSIANQTRIFQNRMEDLQANFGSFINDLFDVGSSLNTFGNNVKKLSDYLKKDGYTLSYALKEAWVNISFSVETFYAYTFSPIVSGIIAGFQNIITIGQWFFDNWKKLFDGLSEVETNFFLNLSKDIYQTGKDLALWTVASFGQAGEKFMNFTQLNRLILGQDNYYWHNLSNQKMNDTLANSFRNVEIGNAKLKLSSLPKLKEADISAWTDPGKKMGEILDKYNIKMKKLESDLILSFEKGKQKDEKEKEDPQAVKNAGLALDILAKHLHDFKATAANAVLANSQEGIMMQSRRLLYSGTMTQAQKETKIMENTKKSVAIQQQIEKTLGNISDVASNIYSMMDRFSGTTYG